ncbi:MAG: polymer-forming cytoskeletal protein [Firmicutes bacterium]|nr:polymer-forming cytoskeletal protein [Bacillota bacterium]
MFGKKEINNEKIDTLIGKNTRFEGKIEASGTIRLDGILDGDITIEGNVIIGKEGKVKGNIRCSSILVSGVVEGNIIGSDQLRITNTGKVFGDIQVNNFIVDENATFEGNCKMKQTTSETKKETKKNKTK